MELKDRIKARRLELGLTLEEVSDKLDIGRSTLHKYESGTISNIPTDKIEKLAKILKTTPVSLLGWDNFSNYVDEKRLSKENSFYDFLDSLGYEFIYYDKYTYHLNYKGKTYKVGLDECLKLMESISKYSNFIVEDFLKTATIIE